MEHLFNSVVDVYRMQRSAVNGQTGYAYVKVTDLTGIACRLDLNFTRPGKDALPNADAGRAPDRFGVAFFSADTPLKAGDVIKCVPNINGEMPVSGWFDIRPRPDEIQDYFTQHHQEVQIIEVAQAVSSQIGPSQS